MKITRIAVHKTTLPYVDGTYIWGAGNELSDAVASVVVVETDSGLTGCGEFTPCGENYMVAHSEGVEAAMRLIAPELLGQDPREVSRIELLMDGVIRGHGYAKAPVDAACWDILGKSTGQPVWMLLGGKLTDGASMYRVAPQKSTAETVAELERYREAGYSQFQIKVGGDWRTDIDRIRETIPLLAPTERAFVDANQGWRVDHAVQVARATADLAYVLEQPCRTYEECQQVRQHTDHPMKLDECVTDMRVVHQIVEDRGAEIVCLKLSNLGGLSKARRVRDYLVANRVPVFAEDSWGAEITSATVAHFATSTPSNFLVATTDLHNYVTRSTGSPAPETRAGKLYAPNGPGLGVEPDFAALGPPVAEYSM